MITNTIRAQYGGAPQNSLMYSKPYTKRIDILQLPAGYQPPKFQQFDGKGNPKQHIAHFIETCNNVGMDGTCSLSNSCVLFEETPLIGTRILSLSPLIVGSRWKGNS